jgi:hypothetical protein
MAGTSALLVLGCCDLWLLPCPSADNCWRFVLSSSCTYCVAVVPCASVTPQRAVHAPALTEVFVWSWWHVAVHHAHSAAGPSSSILPDFPSLLISCVAVSTTHPCDVLSQAVIERSERQFTGDSEADPVAFATWLLNALHLDLAGSRKASSIVTECFQVRLYALSVGTDHEVSIGRHTWTIQHAATEAMLPLLCARVQLRALPAFLLCRPTCVAA